MTSSTPQDNPFLGPVLLTRERIAARVAELAAQIHASYDGRELTILAVMNGAAVFLADLIRNLTLPIRIETTTARSYRGPTIIPGSLTVGNLHRPAFVDRHVLVVDDILDSGRTLHLLSRRLAEFAPASLASCVLLSKLRASRAVPVEPRYVGFEIPDQFVVGYGLDYDGLYRNLPDLCLLNTPQEPLS